MATDQRPRSLADIGNGSARESRAGGANGNGARVNGNGGNGGNGGPVSSTAIGWDIYRGLADTNDGAGASRRQGASKLYTLKAYKAWAARVRANWDPES
ncbi:MAG: hypothetical protein WBO47_12045 [Gammaproteobacteria bacterium]